MSVREILNEVRAEYEAMSTYELLMALQSFGVSEDSSLVLSREEIIEVLMAFEEKAAFE